MNYDLLESILKNDIIFFKFSSKKKRIIINSLHVHKCRKFIHTSIKIQYNTHNYLKILAHSKKTNPFSRNKETSSDNNTV